MKNRGMVSGVCGPEPAAGRQAVPAATSVDVARAAGVSRATVSGVFTPGSRMSGAMREKVLAAAALGYRPNAFTRGLVAQRSGMIGIAIRKMRNPFHPQVLEMFGDALRRDGCQVLPQYQLGGW